MGLDVFIYSWYVSCIQMLVVVFQSIVLGYLTDYFSIQDPSTKDTRNAYLYALGRYNDILMI